MRQKLLLLGAVLFGLIAFVLTYQQIEAKKRELMGGTEEVVLIRLKKNKLPNDELTLDDLERVVLDRSKDAAKMSRDLEWRDLPRVVGRQLEHVIPAGQILQSTDLKPISRRQGFSGIIQKELRAVAIPVDPVSSINNLVQPNDNVDVIGTFRFPDMRGDSSLDTVTLTILQNVKVLAVGNRWGAMALDPTGGRTYGTVSLLLYPEEVEMIIFASQKGKLSLSLRNYEDERISRDIEKRSVNFRLLEQEIPKYNERRENRRKMLPQ